MSFGRLERSKADKPMSDINVTPLVDVMLVLLVIFIIAAPFMASRLSLELPKAEVPAPAPAAPEASVSIALDAQGRLHWNDEPLAEDALRQRLQATAQRNPETELQLRADASVPYGRVVQLIGMAQTAGLSRIGFVADAPAPGAR
jgi:biopolymer transport protein ExbD